MAFFRFQISAGMFKNYTKVSVRNILKHKLFSLINIFGLAVAMSVCMLIILMLADQKSYDQHQEKKDRVYRILSEGKNVPIPTATTPFPLASKLKTDYAFVEEASQLIMGVGGDVIRNSNAFEMRGFFAEPAFFNIMTYEFEKGDKNTALQAPNSMVITHEKAKQLFGDADPIGQTVEFVDRGLLFLDLDFIAMDSPPQNWGSFTVTGVLAEKRHKTHLKFDALVSTSSLPALHAEKKIADLSENWKNHSRCYTYVLLRPEANESDLSTALASIASTQYTDIEDLQGTAHKAQKLTQITPGIFVGNPSLFNLPIEAYYFLAALAAIIMISACLNYTNLSIARALTRLKEIGVRKVTGARRQDLVLQFLSESVIMALLALVTAILLLFLIKPAFMSLWLNTYFNFDLQANLQVYIIFGCFAVAIGIVAGIFPALNLSKYKPVKVLKKISGIRPGNLGLRKFLSISQFAVSLFFIITCLLVYNQFKHFMGFEYGFTSKNIINIELQSNDYQMVRNELATVPGVSQISACEFLPATAVSSQKELKKPGSDDEPTNIQILKTDEFFVDNLNLKILEGRNLPPAGDASDGLILVNETAMKKLGYENPSEIIGQFFLLEGRDEAIQIAGVLEDFRFQSPMFADGIAPLMIQNDPSEFRFLNVKVVSKDLKNTIANLEQKWASIDAVHPFKYHFFDDQIAMSNQLLADILSILAFFAFLAVTIACLGLLGMATYTVERRTKEVGIRKVLGASDFTLAFLLSFEFLRVLIIAIVIAAPLSYFANSAWLQHFPNRVEFGFGTVVLGSFLLLLLGLITIGSQSLRAARINPVESIRIE